MNIIVMIKFMRISFEASSVAATKLPSGWWALKSTLGLAQLPAVIPEPPVFNLGIIIDTQYTNLITHVKELIC